MHMFINVYVYVSIVFMLCSPMLEEIRNMFNKCTDKSSRHVDCISFPKQVHTSGDCRTVGRYECSFHNALTFSIQEAM